MQRNVKDACKSDRSCQELSTEYLIAKFGFDTGKNESSGVCQKLVRQLDRLRYYNHRLDVLGFFVIAYDMVAIPMYLAFSRPPGYVLEEPWILGTLTRVFWTCECLISFNTAYINRVGDLVMDRRKCIVNHLKTWFIVDVLTIGVDWTKILLEFVMENGLGATFILIPSSN